MIYKDRELKCTEIELNDFIASIQTSYEIRDFSMKYNNVEIENPTGDESAKYYILNVNGCEYPQFHVPFVQGFTPITDANAVEIIEQHKQKIIDNLIYAKFAVSEEDKREQRIAELEAAMAAMLGGAM